MKKFEENKKKLEEDLRNQLQFYDFNQGGSSVSTEQVKEGEEEQEIKN